jgi:beta-lactamase class A
VAGNGRARVASEARGMRAARTALLIVVLMAALPVPFALAQGAPRPVASSTLATLEQQRIDAFWTTGPQQDWFATSFLQAVPFPMISPIAKRVTDGLGAYRRTTGSAGTYISEFEKGTVEIRIHLDANGKIDGLRLLPPVLTTGGIEAAAKQMNALPGTVAYVLIQNHKERAAQNADAPLAVGSAFKLAILAALQDQITAGRRHWSDVVPLDERWKSLPSGVLQSWPAGTPITIETYAAEMISISDNTAADALAAIVGAPAVARYASRNTPFLTTRALFVLRTHPDLLAKWKTGDRFARSRLLDQLARLPLPGPNEITSSIGDLSVEWLYTPRELCALMDKVANLPLMSINPGVADPAKFARIAFKGGSEPGVLAFVTAVVTKSGSHACLALTVNNAKQSVDETSATLPYGAMLNAIGRF